MGWLSVASPDFAIAQGLTFIGVVSAMAAHIYKQVSELLGLGSVPLLKR